VAALVAAAGSAVPAIFLRARLRAAARTVCGAPERGEAAAHFARRDCYAQSIAQAMRGPEADRQLVAALRP
jgi:UrcA family protein